MSASVSGWMSRLGLGSRLPVVLQVEAAECGLACLAMVASYHGLTTDLTTLRRRFPLSLRGVNLKSLMRIAQAVNLAPRALKLDLDDLSQLATPCILHWDMNHFVALKSVGARRVVVHDPASGERSMSLETFGQHFTGVALELTPTSAFEPRNEVQAVPLRRLTGRLVGLWGGLAQVLALSVGLEALALLAPFYLQWTVDQALVSGDRELLTVLALGFGALVLIQAGIGAVRGWAVVVLGTMFHVQWQHNVFAHLLRLPLDYFEKRHVGDIVSRFTSIATIQKTLTVGFVQAIVDGLLLVGTLSMMALYSVKLTVIALVGATLYALLRAALFRPLRHATAEQIVHAAKQQTHFLESVRGIQTVRLFGRADDRRASWMNLLLDQFNADVRIQRLGVAYQTANTLLVGLERVVLVWLAARAVLDHAFSVGMLFAFIAYKDQFSSRMAALIDRGFEWRMLRLHGERVADIVLTAAEPIDAPEMDEALGPGPLEVELRGVGYAYSPLDAPVLQDVNLTLRAGESVALTGPSGSGKTTLVKILLGLLEPTTGSVWVNGRPLSAVGRHAYRRRVGTVMQDDTLFSGSVADNVSFFDPSADPQRVAACAAMAACLEEIQAMPMGFHTLVGGGGGGVSGGQKQRLLLARALYGEPSMLVLDEATSHLDLRNEQAVNEVVRRLPLTRVIVAHRPETIATAERVVVLDRGRVVSDAPGAARRAP